MLFSIMTYNKYREPIKTQQSPPIKTTEQTTEPSPPPPQTNPKTLFSMGMFDRLQNNNGCPSCGK